MKNRAVVFLAFFVGISVSLSAFGSSYDYVNVFNERHTISIQTSPAWFVVGDRAVDANICDQSASFVCVTSDSFNFAVPVARKPDVLKWDYKGHSYVLKNQGTLEALGHRIKVWRIESTQGVQKFRYLFAEKEGLLAISIEVGADSQTFISRRAAGFGAQISGK